MRRIAAETILEIGTPAAGCLPRLQEAAKTEPDRKTRKALNRAIEEVQKPTDYYEAERVKLVKELESKFQKDNRFPDIGVGIAVSYLGLFEPLYVRPKRAFEISKSAESTLTLTQYISGGLRWEISAQGNVTCLGEWSYGKPSSYPDYTGEELIAGNRFRNVNQILKDCLKDGFKYECKSKSR